MDAERLPPLLDTWLHDLVDGEIPREVEATCDDCAMCRPDPTGLVPPFDPSTKCCTYAPNLANFQVGQILRDLEPALAAGRETVEQRLAAGIGATPLGLARAPVYDLLYRASANERGAAFGHAAALRCPHHIDGRCSIWSHRESVCATWFCKHVRGARGQRFWRAVRSLLGRLEAGVARHCLVELDVGPEALRELIMGGADAAPNHLTAADLAGRTEPGRWQQLWGRWAGRERAFYLECAAIVDGLDPAAVRALGGAEATALARVVRDARRELGEVGLPARLRPASARVLPLAPESCRVTTYSGYDALELPRRLLDVLPVFAGRTTEEAIRLIADDHDVELEPELVARLVDFELLVPDRDDRPTDPSQERE